MTRVNTCLIRIRLDVKVAVPYLTRPNLRTQSKHNPKIQDLDPSNKWFGFELEAILTSTHQPNSTGPLEAIRAFRPINPTRTDPTGLVLS